MRLFIDDVRAAPYGWDYAHSVSEAIYDPPDYIKILDWAEKYYNKDNAAWWWNDKYHFLRVSNNSVYPWLTEEDSWADEIPIGWRDSFFENMCDDLISALGDYVDNFEIIQLKEKYGSMRLYWDWKNEGFLTEEQIRNLTSAIHDVISKYEAISYHTCVRCGRPSTGYTKPWILPVCDECNK